MRWNFKKRLWINGWANFLFIFSSLGEWNAAIAKLILSPKFCKSREEANQWKLCFLKAMKLCAKWRLRLKNTTLFFIGGWKLWHHIFCSLFNASFGTGSRRFILIYLPHRSWLSNGFGRVQNSCVGQAGCQWLLAGECQGIQANVHNKHSHSRQPKQITIPSVPIFSLRPVRGKRRSKAPLLSQSVSQLESGVFPCLCGSSSWRVSVCPTFLLFWMVDPFYSVSETKAREEWKTHSLTHS